MGELLLEFQETLKERTLNYQKKVGRFLGKEITLRQMIHEITTECRDLDEITTKEDS